ncbi:MAG TPA: 2-isopropylmalate synthase [Candidatus Dormibacteraeota bacterium]|jgi:2-isopropylmalate synthase|nr:2-isopropylmalate synthase [Candidatus Dormibacteraeota bacterium]
MAPADPNRVYIFDTTLRDGEQAPGFALNVEEKVEIAHQLARLGVDVIEAGFPISSPGDFTACQRIAREVGTLDGAPMITALARAVPKDIDAVWNAIKDAPRKQIHIVLSVSDIHIDKKGLGTRQQVLEKGIAAVEYARQFCDFVEYSPEDAGRADRGYLYETVEAMIEAGATVINVPDTTGYTLPHEFGGMIGDLMRHVRNVGNAIISVHCHNDLGLAVANSLAAIDNGARRVECTINGIGERAGNASLEELVMILRTREKLLGLTTGVNTRLLAPTSQLVQARTGMHVQANKAIVGANAFAHASGIHQDGVLKDKLTYEIMTPEEVGVADTRIVLSPRSGRHAFRHRLQELGYDLADDAFARAWEAFLALADKKKEVTDRDLQALVADEARSVPERFTLQLVQVSCGTSGRPSATVRLHDSERPDRILEDAAIGDGPVDAVCNAIGRLVDMPTELVDFTVRAVTGGLDAMGEASVRVRHEERIFSGHGADTDIIVASAKAYCSALNKVAAEQPAVSLPAGSGV